MMTDVTKITLSSKELELVCNTEWILTKQLIIKKVIHLFGDVLSVMHQISDANKLLLPVEVFIKNAKISKGENYNNLPYVMLDYPRFFDKEETLAVRTMFWWGNFFSINLQLSGKIKDKYTKSLKDNFAQLQKWGYYICIANNPWQHNFEEDNYVPLQSLTSKTFEALLNEKPFVKIGKKITLQHWDAVALFTEQSFEEFLTLLKINYPTDEKDL